MEVPSDRSELPDNDEGQSHGGFGGTLEGEDIQDFDPRDYKGYPGLRAYRILEPLVELRAVRSTRIIFREEFDYPCLCSEVYLEYECGIFMCICDDFGKKATHWMRLQIVAAIVSKMKDRVVATNGEPRGFKVSIRYETNGNWIDDEDIQDITDLWDPLSDEGMIEGKRVNEKGKM